MAQAGEQNLLVLTFYMIGISYVFNRMVDSIDDNIKYEFDKGAIDEQLKEYNLQDDVGVAFKFKPSYEIGNLKEMMLLLNNKSENLGVYVDWDNSSLVIDFDSSSHRIIRTSPDLSRDLGTPQHPTLVAPKKGIAGTFSIEGVFKRDQEKGTYSAEKPIIPIAGLKTHPVKARRKLYKDFITRKTNITYSMQLVLRISELRVGVAPGENKPPMYIINCPFTIKKLPWTYAMPWNKKR